MNYEPPVQIPANTLISFPDPPRAKRYAIEYCPAAPDLILTKDALLSFFPGGDDPSFFCVSKRKKAKKTTPGRGRFRFLPLPGPTPIETTRRGPAGPLLEIPRVRSEIIRRNSNPLPIWRGSCRYIPRFPDSPFPRGSRVRNNRAGRLAIPADSHGFACCSSFSDNQPL